MRSLVARPRASSPKVPSRLMILVDTSVWLRFLGGREPYATELDRLLMENDVLAHELVYGELLLGDRGRRAKLLAEYERMQRAATVQHGEVVGLVRSRNLHDRGVGWVDVHLLASTLIEKARLWTADEGLSRLAREAGVAHELRRGKHVGTEVPYRGGLV